MNSRNYLWVPLIVLGLALTFAGAVLTPTLNGLGVWGFLIAVAGLVGADRCGSGVHVHWRDAHPHAQWSWVVGVSHVGGRFGGCE